MPSQAADHLVHLLAFLRRSYEPRWTPWTDKSEEEARQVTAEWVDALGAYELPVIMEAARRWTEGDDGAQHPSLMDLLRLVQAVAREHVTAVASRTHPPVRCDGSGWIETMPCPTCSPVLYDLWCDDDAWGRWRSGTPLHLVSDRVEQRRGLTTLRVGQMPHPCLPEPEAGLPHDVNRMRMNLVAQVRDEVRAQMHVLAHPEPDEEGVTPPRLVLDAEARGDLAMAVMAGIFHGEAG